MNQDVFEKYSIKKAVATLALPTMLSMLVTIFYNMADTLFVGWTNDPNQVAAVSLATPVFLLLMAVGNIFGIGGSTLISRLLGEKKEDKVKKVSSFCFYGCIVAGAVMTVVFLVGMPAILSLIGCSENTRGFAESYLTCIGIGAIFVVLSNAFGNVVRGEGAAKTSMFGMMLGTVVNIVLDPIMILVMDMGVAGAAIATIIGNICSVVYYVIYLCGKKTALSISIKNFSAKEGILLAVFSIGLPASINNVLMSTSNIILNNFLAGYGDNPVAAMGVAMKANMLVVMLQMGLAMGIQPLIGYCFGAGNIDKMKKVLKFSVVCNVILGSALTLFYVFFSKQIVNIFIDDIEVVNYGITMLRALMLSGPFIGMMFVFNFSFQAMGKAIPSLILSLSRQGLVFLPVLVIANHLVGLNGLIYAQPLADIASLFMAVLMYLIIFRKHK
ncbi:MAG: MATE family efflux transporter [Lachnospiraceae bacterium]|nr:MATE family efflux transporter [Lachnospiraceae bacterium]